MGLFDFFTKGASEYNDPYDYRTDVVLKCVDRLLDGDIGNLRKIKHGNDWMFAGGTIRGLMGTKVLNDNYYIKIESFYYKGISVNECVKKMCNMIDRQSFINQCDLYASRPIF